MTKYNMILLPLDVSECSRKVCFLAKNLSDALDLPICILHISDEQISKDELIKKLNLRKEDYESAVIVHKSGNPEEIIIDESKKYKLVILSTKCGEKDINTISTGKFAKVIQQISVPVVFVRPDIEIDFNIKKWIFKRALIPISGKPSRSMFLESPINILKKLEMSVDILHISTNKPHKEIEPGCLSTPYYEDYPQHEWANWKNEFAKRFCPSIVKPNVHLSTGQPEREILDFAKKENIDLIVTVWKGNFEKEHALIFKKILLKARCPILIKKINGV